MDISIGLSEHQCKQMATVLNALLADEFTLYVKTLNFHWNVIGHDFKPLHDFFRQQYEDVFSFVDDVAERVRTLGGDSLGSMTKFLATTHLKEAPGKLLTSQEMLRILLEDHEAVICTLREYIDESAKVGDMGTNNFLTDLMEKHEKIAWMIRSSMVK
ncbi:DNA starvation/stationary phase protection protein [Candidatus Dependentiae bacterium]|nr:DNA starvation/stationary phase protection protein [Candidatus Dependentiae bacterium]